MSEPKTPSQLDAEIEEYLDPFTKKKVEHGIILYVGRPRRDGKIPCTFVFKSSGARIGKLLTPEALAIERAKVDEVRPKR